jgi:hypothetical protein
VGIVGNEMADQLARTGSEHPFIRPEPACGRDWTDRNHKKYWESTTGLKQAKGFISGHCQQNEGSVETKQRPTKVGGRITYWTLPP